MGKTVYVNDPKVVTYGKIGEVFHGQIIELQGLKNDDLMLAPHIAYFKIIEEEQKRDIEECLCGRRFINGHFKQLHMREMPHDKIDLDANLRQDRPRGPNGRFQPVNPEGEGRLPLESVGAPTAPHPSADAPVAGEHGSKAVREGPGTKEVFRIGGGPPKGL